MSDNASVVVFPAIFAQNKMDSLISNIKKILKIQNQKFQKISKDNSVIIVEANDPVFASSAINLLFGIDRVAIAKQVKNDYESLVSSIAKIGTNLLLKGDKFYVKVEGHAKGFLPNDVEMAVTSTLIEKTSKLGSKPGTEEKYDKLIYTYLTKANGYVCIYTDKGNGGIPNNSLNEKIICCIYDELSAVSCLETIRQGYDVKIIVCFQKESDLVNLVKIVNRIIQRTLESKIEIIFFKIALKGSSSKNYLLKVETIVEILLDIASKSMIKRISLPVSPLIFPQYFIDKISKKVSQKNKISHIPLSGIDENILDCAKEIGLEKYLPNLEKLGKMKFDIASKETDNSRKIAQKALSTKKIVSITLGPNNVHDMIDSLKSDH